MSNVKKEEIAAWFRNLQDHICAELESIDGKGSFVEDLWQRDEGGGGRSRVLSGGAVVEKGGVNCSEVFGPLPEAISKGLGMPKGDFYATGISIVIHPEHALVPIIHMNLRYFEMDGGQSWFGGGIDLTPHYVHDEDARFFHQSLKRVCDAHHASYYTEFKEWADNYFYIPHREETRGIGGIFFDRLSATDELTMEDRFAFVKEVGEAFVPIYSDLIERNRTKAIGEREKKWQMLRRSRYVEFNLVYDKGTMFGLKTKGRIESILMSLPPVAHWDYNVQPEAGTLEELTIKKLKKGLNWAESI